MWNRSNTRPRLTLVLGSGGVRSIAAARSAGQRVLELEPGLDRHVGLWETRAMPYLFEAGRGAARAQMAQITALARLTSRQAPEFGSMAA